jgi:hypothetical protein
MGPFLISEITGLVSSGNVYEWMKVTLYYGDKHLVAEDGWHPGNPSQIVLHCAGRSDDPESPTCRLQRILNAFPSDVGGPNPA